MSLPPLRFGRPGGRFHSSSPGARSIGVFLLFAFAEAGGPDGRNVLVVVIGRDAGEFMSSHSQLFFATVSVPPRVGLEILTKRFTGGKQKLL